MVTDADILEELFTKTEYMVVAVVLPGGKPWAVPVHVKHREGHTVFEWVSNPETVHSKAIAAKPNVAITMFYMNVGFYAQAKAEVMPGEVNEHDQVWYRAVVERCWLNHEFVKREVPLQETSKN